VLEEGKVKKDKVKLAVGRWAVGRNVTALFDSVV
jgi:hypothetical protein